ncbi:molybdopterin-dependent oxidoreductase [Bacillus salitolerans]|uniref:Molybdopterin-dependent oxidoreductase n=1 Tax=Bacillus salitolerans TaxID=1437434 RepID=A0ABW4LU03_9BACI
MVTKHRSVCPLDCPDTCGLTVAIDDNTITSVTGDKAHPITNGVICHKARKFPERVHHPARLKYPLKRIGAKGDHSFERISWDEAYNLIVEKFTSIIDLHGAESILPYSFYGNMGLLNSDGMDRRYFHRLGASHLDRTICNSAASAGYKYTMGFPVGIDPEETVHAKLIIVWGCNLFSTNMHQVLYFNQARKNGAKIVVIDVHQNRTAKWADWFIQLKPGTDTALALGMMNVLISHNLVNYDFVNQFTTGFDELQKESERYTPEYVSAITGVSEEDIMKLAKLYGNTTPSFIRIGNGLQHHENGGMMIRTITCLPALTGQWGIRGGGALKGNGSFYQYNMEKLQRPDLRPSPNVRTVNMNQIGDALIHEDPPIFGLFVYNSNPAQVAPDQTKVRKGLVRDDLFTVVHDLFLTDTCKYADLVLPATSHFENLDLYKSYWHLYLQLNEPIMQPYFESKSNFTLFKELAHRMGFTGPEFQITEEEMLREALDHKNSPFLSGITYERLQKEKIIKLSIPEASTFPHTIPTPSGKIELYSERMKLHGLPPVPTYIPIQESDKFKLQFISGPNHQFINSTFSNLDELKKMEGKPLLYLHPNEASQRELLDGETVTVYNDLGSIAMTLKITEEILPGMALTQGLWWDDPEHSISSVNFLTSQRLSDMGGGATFFSAWVEVRKMF